VPAPAPVPRVEDDGWSGVDSFSDSEQLAKRPPLAVRLPRKRQVEVGATCVSCAHARAFLAPSLLRVPWLTAAIDAGVWGCWPDVDCVCVRADTVVWRAISGSDVNSFCGYGLVYLPDSWWCLRSLIEVHVYVYISFRWVGSTL
jgi:hypothetical protein